MAPLFFLNGFLASFTVWDKYFSRSEALRDLPGVGCNRFVTRTVTIRYLSVLCLHELSLVRINS